MQELTVVKIVDFGVYLAESEETAENRVLLPAKQVPEGTEKGSVINVFLYRDSQDRIIATIKRPALMLNETGVLRVAQVGKIGAFLDWGLEKDLFLPFKEQTCKVKEGDEVFVAVYLDKSERLCATMKVYPYLKTNPVYRMGDMVKARIYGSNEKFGLFIAVEDKYSGLIQKKDAQGKYSIGEVLNVRIVQIREDGRIDATPKQKAYIQMENDAEMVLDRLRDEGGLLLFDDRVDPEIINKEFGISKAAFKRAVGRLLKEKKVKIENGKIYMI